jgi:hypothetical protein
MAFQLSPADLAEVSNLSLDELRTGLSQTETELATEASPEIQQEIRAWIRAYQCALIDALEKEMTDLEKAECGCCRHDEMSAVQALWDEADKERHALLKKVGCRCGDVSGETVIVWCERCELGPSAAESEKPVVLGTSSSGTVITSPPSAGTLQELLLAACGGR